MITAAAVVLVEDGDGRKAPMVILWDVTEGFPFDDFRDAEEALSLTAGLVSVLQANATFEAEGFGIIDTQLTLGYLSLGVKQIQDRLPDLRILDEDNEIVAAVVEALMDIGLYNPDEYLLSDSAESETEGDPE